MITRIIIWIYLIFVLPPVTVIMLSLMYGGVVETVKRLQPQAAIVEEVDRDSDD